MSCAPEYVWGVDVAIGHIAFAFAPMPTGTVETDFLIATSEFAEGERLGKLDRQIRIRARQLQDRFPPYVVWVEQPGSHPRMPEPALMYAVGVTQAALFEALGCPVWSIPISKWKKRSVGRGNATKADVTAWVQGRQPGLCGTQDERDAFCIAHAGRDIMLSGRWDGEAAA